MGTEGCVDSGDTSWVMVSTVLVLCMFPGLAFFEAGLLRSKNTLSIVGQVFAGMAINGALWDLIGFSLVYYGSFTKHVLWIGVSYTECSDYAPTIPAAAFATFMLLFAVITPLLMTGAYAERVKFKSTLALTVLFELFVYYPIAQMVWGNGWLMRMGVKDFAGGITIHTTAGMGALACALYLGPRRFFAEHGNEFPPSNVALAAIGTAFLYFGWFGFNAGSALQAGSISTSAVVSTQIGCIFSTVVWLILDLVTRGQPTVIGLLNGAIAGLAGITPASGFINNPGSIGLGIVLGFASYFSAHFVKNHLHIDDALDVSSVHGLTGMIGSIATGFLATKEANPNVDDGLFYGGGARLLGVQVLAVVITAVYSIIVTFIILKFIDWTMGLRATPEQEDLGLDISEHHEVAYHELTVDIITPEMVRKLPRHYRNTLTDLRQRTDYRVLNVNDNILASPDESSRILVVDKPELKRDGSAKRNRPSKELE
jgi:Amt family ammonium transporter